MHGTMANRPDREGRLPVAGNDTRGTLASLLGDNEVAADRLRKSVLPGLAADAERVRESTAWALCLLADDHPDVLPGLIADLLECLSGDARTAARRVLGHLCRQYPEHVRTLLKDAGHDPGTVLPMDPGPHPLDADGEYRRSDRIAVIRELLDRTGRSSLDEEAGEQSRSTQRSDRSTSTTSTTSRQSGVDDARDAHAGRRVEAPKRVQKRREIDEIEGSDTFLAIRERTVFDDLAIVEPRDGGRYADTVRACAIEDDEEECGVALGLLDRPEDDRAGYADAMADKLARWQAAGHAAGILTIRDWGREPRPWLAKEPIEETLAEWQPTDTAARLDCAHKIARAVAACHRQGVIHAGLDPGNVVMPDGQLAAEPRPALDNVGCMLAFREYFEPADYLDPRYAAPEYFDDSYGGIDQSTDVYQLGAVLYHCFTGRAPFRGTYADIRQGVLDGEPTPPTELNASLPDPIDEIITKALSKRKLTRYETASQLRGDIQRICERCGL